MKSRREQGDGDADHGNALRFTVQAREFGMPPIHDALVLGRASHIGCVAMRKAISLLVASPFEHIEVDDDVVSNILVRANILKRCSAARFTTFVLSRIKPLMTEEEVLHLDIAILVLLEEEMV